MGLKPGPEIVVVITRLYCAFGMRECVVWQCNG